MEYLSSRTVKITQGHADKVRMTRRVPASLVVLASLALVFALFNAVALGATEDCGPGVEAVRVDGQLVCTHGNDEAPPGVDTTQLPSTDELLEARFGVDTPAEVAVEVAGDSPTVAATNAVACIGDGITGPRVQLVYARAANVASRYDSVIPLIRQYAADADDIINVSAGRVGDGRRVRFVTNNNCLPQVLNVTLSNTGDDTFGNMVTELRNEGLTSPDRKYLVFMDAAVGICGLGEVYLNDSRDQSNPNNSGRPMYARVDTSCWQHAAAHELLHTMGAVQNSAPNSSGAGHCTDEIDVMCYKDTTSTVTRQVCTRAGQVDCNNNDYFHPNPGSGTYLDNKWNVARSRYLETDNTPPPPAVTNVSVPSSAMPGVPTAVQANTAHTDANVVWSSTRSECWFDAPRAKFTTWTCPATADAGAAVITVNVTENGVTTPYDKTITVTVPSEKQVMSASTAVSASKIRAGQLVSVTGKFMAMATGAPVAGLPVHLQSQPKGTKTWNDIALDKTGPNGLARFDVSPMRNTKYRVRSATNPTWQTTIGAGEEVAVSAKLSTKLNSRTVAGMITTQVREYNTIRLAGKVSPDKSGDTIRLKRYRHGRWRTIREKRINDNSGFVFKYTPRYEGRHRLRIVKPTDLRNVKSIRYVRLSVD